LYKENAIQTATKIIQESKKILILTVDSQDDEFYTWMDNITLAEAFYLCDLFKWTEIAATAVEE
jgi:hypothetical protein